jgi:hypothetical protein
VTGIPTWKAAVVSGPGNAGMANQFLVPHNATLIFDGATLQSSSTTGDSNYTTTQGQYLSQQFQTTSTQTTISQVWVQVSVVGGSALTSTIDPLIVSVYADVDGEPGGTPLASASLSETAVYASGFWVVLPMNVTGLTTSTTYHLVTSPAGTSSTYYVWQNSNAASGGSISPDNVAWTDQTFGFMYQVYDASTAGSTWQYLLEDSGAHWSYYTYSSNLLSSVTEYTVNQVGTGSATYTRSLTYSGNLLTGVN